MRRDHDDVETIGPRKGAMPAYVEPATRPEAVETATMLEAIGPRNRAMPSCVEPLTIPGAIGPRKDLMPVCVEPATMPEACVDGAKASRCAVN